MKKQLQNHTLFEILLLKHMEKPKSTIIIVIGLEVIKLKVAARGS